MRYHLFPHWADAPPRLPLPTTEKDGTQSLPDPGNPDRKDELNIAELCDLIGWLRQRLRGEHTVRANVLYVESTGSDSYHILLGEVETRLTSDPPRLKARLDAVEIAQIQADYGMDFDLRSLVNRTVTIRLRTSLRRRSGRGADVQAKVMRLLSVGQIPLEGDLERERTLQRLRLEGRRFGPDVWSDPEDLRHVALIVSEHGDVRQDVDYVLRPLEEAGIIQIHRVWAIFEGPGAERSLAEAFARVASLQREHGLSVTLICRGGGPIEAFQPLNAYETANAALAAELPNLITGLGHAGTPRTALDAVAARCEPTPTAAASLVRHLVERTGIRAERALAEFDAAIEEELEVAGRATLARVGAAFDMALQGLADEADERLREVDRGIERGLLGSLAAASKLTAELGLAANTVVFDPPGNTGDYAIPSAVLVLVSAAKTGIIVTTAEQARAEADLLLHFSDGAVLAQVTHTSIISSVVTH